MTSATNDLARITVDTPDRRLDLAVPADAPLADLVRLLVSAGGERLGERGAATGWVVRRGDGAPLSGAQTLYDQGVRDGDVLRLVQADEIWPELEYDDIAEAIAATRRDSAAWSPVAARRTGIGAGVAALLCALLAIVRDTAHPATSLLAGGCAAVLLGAGVVIARAGGDRSVGAVVAAVAIPYAAVAGLLARGDRPYAIDLLVACAVAALVAWFGALAVGRTTWVFIAAGLAAVAGVVGAALDRLITPVGAAAIVLSVLALGAGLIPVAAVRWGGLGDWPTDALASAVSRGEEIVTGSCCGVAVVAAAASTVLARSGLAWPLLLGLAAAIALGVRSRAYGVLRQRLAALIAGACAGLPLLVWAVWTGFAPVAVVAALVLTGALLIAARPASARLAAVVEAITLLAILPLLCGALNLYAKARALS